MGSDSAFAALPTTPMKSIDSQIQLPEFSIQCYFSMVPGLFRNDEILVFVLPKRASYDQQSCTCQGWVCLWNVLQDSLPPYTGCMMGPDTVTGQFSFSGGGRWCREGGTVNCHHHEFWLFTWDPLCKKVLCTHLGRTGPLIPLDMPLSHTPSHKGEVGDKQAPKAIGSCFSQLCLMAVNGNPKAAWYNMAVEDSSLILPWR